jgi:hypothetical protein
MLCSQVGEALHKHLQCTDVLKNALSGTGTLVLGWDDYDKSKRLDKSAMQLNLVLPDCLHKPRSFVQQVIPARLFDACGQIVGRKAQQSSKLNKVG